MYSGSGQSKKYVIKERLFLNVRLVAYYDRRRDDAARQVDL